MHAGERGGGLDVGGAVVGAAAAADGGDGDEEEVNDDDGDSDGPFLVRVCACVFLDRPVCGSFVVWY